MTEQTTQQNRWKKDLKTIKASRVTLALAGVMIACFVATIDYESLFSISESAVYYQYGYIPTHADVYRAFTSIFMHANWAHLGINLVFLIYFGPAVEKELGKVIYIALFMGSGIASVFLYSMAYPSSTLPIVGMSGALMGLVGVGAAIGHKESKEIFYTQIGLFVLATILISNTIDVPFITNVGYMAHFGGFIFAYLVMKGAIRSQKASELEPHECGIF